MMKQSCDWYYLANTACRWWVCLDNNHPVIILLDSHKTIFYHSNVKHFHDIIDRQWRLSIIPSLPPVDTCHLKMAIFFFIHDLINSSWSQWYLASVIRQERKCNRHFFIEIVIHMFINHSALYFFPNHFWLPLHPCPSGT